MSKRSYIHNFLLLASLFILASPFSLYAQEAKPFGEIPGLIKEDAFILDAKDTIIVFQNGQELFPHVNGKRYYRDKNILQEIQILEQQDEIDTTRLDVLLVDYIDNFGTENFREDIQLLWKAAQLKQAMGDTTKARFYYELFIKHTIGRSQRGRLAYDSLVAPTRSDWLPIDEYYELLAVRKRVDPLTPSKEDVESMGGNINSGKPDYAPFMQPRRGILVFTSRRDGGDEINPFDKPNEELYYSYIDESTNEWIPAQKLSDNINTEFNEGSACLAPDGITLYFTRCGQDLPKEEEEQLGSARLPRAYKKKQKLPRKLSKKLPKGYNQGFDQELDKEGNKAYAKEAAKKQLTPCERTLGDCDIYQATYYPESDTWGEICNLGPQINSSTWDSQPAISPDGNILFFSSNRPGGFGGTDVYYSVKDTITNKWSKARNLGPVINTPQQEVTPYFHSINNTLYFSSTGQLSNFGGYDIFKSRWMGRHWEEPHNVGPMINTVGNEYYFTIDAKGETIFYSRSNAETKKHISQDFDLYSFPMPMESQPAATTSFKGILRDSITGHPLVGTVMMIDLEDSTRIMPKSINEEGYFEFKLINKKRYKMVVMGDNFLTLEKNFKVDKDSTFHIFTQSIERNQPIVFESLEFRSNSDKLKRDIQPKLEHIAKFLEDYPMLYLTVGGHTDSDGNDEYNLELSKRRAARIAQYITDIGNFEPGRVQAEGYGETKPLVPNDSEENKRKNRRVEFLLHLDESYNGPMSLPSQKELFFDEDEKELDDEFLSGDEYDDTGNSNDLKFESEAEKLEKNLEKSKTTGKSKEKKNN